MNSSIEPSSATAAASTRMRVTVRTGERDQPADRQRGGGSHAESRTWSETRRPSSSVRTRSERAATSGSCVAITSAKCSRSCSAAIRSSTRAAGVGIELAGWLVAQQQVRFPGRARARSPPAGPRRRTARPAARLASRTSPTSASSSAGAELAAGRADVAGKGDVLERSEAREEVRRLKHVPHGASAYLATGGRVERGERLAGERHLPASRHGQPAEHVEQRRLPRSRTPPQPHPIAGGDRQVDVGERGDRVVAAAVHDGDRPANCELRSASRSRLIGATLPSRISTTRSAAAETRAEWVTTTTVLPNESRNSRSESSTRRSLAASSSPVGSSASTSGGRRAAAAAIATRCCSPPDSAPARVSSARPETKRLERVVRRRGWVAVSRELERDHHVAPGAERRPQVGALQDERDATGTEPGAIVLAQQGKGLTVRPDLAGRRSVEGRREREHRALAAARGAEHRDQLAPLHREFEASERDGLDRPGAEDLEHVVELECRPVDRARRPFGFDVQANRLGGDAGLAHCQRKLLLIIRYASTLSTPFAVPRSTSRVCRRARARSGRRSAARACR